jgi:hypothetical protein
MGCSGESGVDGEPSSVHFARSLAYHSFPRVRVFASSLLAGVRFSRELFVPTLCIKCVELFFYITVVNMMY